MEQKTVIITGASGLLGRSVRGMFQKDGWNTVGFAFSRANSHPDLIKVDLTDFERVESVLRDLKLKNDLHRGTSLRKFVGTLQNYEGVEVALLQPRIIVHCAAEKRPDVVEKEPEATQKLNVDATRNLARCAGQHGALILYISTDYVFDGTNPPYEEKSVPNPLNEYGSSKLAGEEATLSTDSDFIVLRVPVLYGPVENIGESAVTVLFDKICGDVPKRVLMSDYELRYPTHTQDIALAVLLLAKEKIVKNNKSVQGIYHWSANECMTKYQMVVEMGRLFQMPTGHIVPEKQSSGGASRPKDAHLSCDRLKQLGAVITIPFATGIKAVLQNQKHDPTGTS